MIGVLQRIKKLIRPRLRHHQLRPQDDPKDLIDYCQTDEQHSLGGLKVIGAQTIPYTVPDEELDPNEEDSLTKIPLEDNPEEMQEEEEEGVAEGANGYGDVYDDDVDDYAVNIPINVSPNKWGPKKG